MIKNKKIAETLKVLNKAAITHLGKGNFSEAIEAFQQSKLLEEKLGLKIQEAESMVNISNAYYHMHEYDASLENLSLALNIFEKEKNRSGIFNVHQLMGSIYFQKEDYKKASHIYDACLRMNLNNEKTALSYFQCGVTYIKLKNFPRAQEYLSRALAEFERVDDNRGIVDCLRHRASLFQLTGRKDLASHDLRRSLTYVEVLSTQDNDGVGPS